MSCHHHCECEHETIKYCKHCDTVYCIDCKREWHKPNTWTYYYTNPGTFTVGNYGTSLTSGTVQTTEATYTHHCPCG